MECAFSLKTAQLKARPWDIEPRFSTDTPGYSSYGMSMPVVCYRAMRRSFVFGLLLFVAAASAILCGETKRNFPRPTGYIDDFANVVDAGTKERLTALCTELDQKTNAQIAVVTVQTLGGSSIEDYALRLFNEWGIGHKEDNRGLLILLSLSERKYRIEVGRGFETLFPDERVATIGAEMIPDLKVQHYSQALLRCTQTLASIVAEERHTKLRSFPSQGQ